MYESDGIADDEIDPLSSVSQQRMSNDDEESMVFMRSGVGSALSALNDKKSWYPVENAEQLAAAKCHLSVQ
jgi:hypothetical protein